MDRNGCISLLNSFLKSPSIQSAGNILLEYLRDKNVENLEGVINEILQTPMVNTKCVEYAIGELRLKYGIVTVSKDDRFILFY